MVYGPVPYGIHKSIAARTQAGITDLAEAYEFRDDMDELNVLRWTSVDDGGTGSNAIQDAVGGIKNIVTAGANDDYHGMKSTAQLLTFGTKAMSFRSRFRLAEADTNLASLFVGVTDTTTTGGLQTGTSGPLASFIGAAWYKIQGTMALKFIVSDGATQLADALRPSVTFTSNVWYQVGFDFDPADGVTGKITPWVYNETTARGRSSPRSPSPSPMRRK